MTTRLVQKHLIKGRREFELSEDAVDVIIDMPFLKKEFTVVLEILDPEPVVKGTNLAFVSAVNREPLLEFFIDNPSPQEYNDFVAKVRERAIEQDFGRPKAGRSARNVNAKHIQEVLDMVQTYLDDDDIQPFLDSLEALKAEPENDNLFDNMYQTFSDLGPKQGAVLTYAPYLVSLLSDDTPE